MGTALHNRYSPEHRRWPIKTFKVLRRLWQITNSRITSPVSLSLLVQMLFPEVVQSAVTLPNSSRELFPDLKRRRMLPRASEALCETAPGVLLHNLPCDSWKQIFLKESQIMNSGLVNQKKPSPTLLFDSYFFFNAAQQGGGAAREEQSFRLLLRTCLSSVHLSIL